MKFESSRLAAIETCWSMKTATSYTLMDKLNRLFNEGQYKDVMSEVRHYLVTLANHARSPLVLDLLDLFKKTVDKDIDDLWKNLDVLAKLFELPGLDVQSEILDIFAKISTFSEIKRVMFERYFAVMQQGFAQLSVESKALAIETLDSLSNGILAHQEASIRYLHQQLESSEPEIKREILETMTRILQSQPDLESTIEQDMDGLIAQYAFETESEVETAFETLFMHLPKGRNHVNDASLQWLQSTDPRLKEKALRLIPIVIETNLDLECIDALVDNLKNADDDLESEIVETLSKIANRNITIYLGHIVNRFLQREPEDDELQNFMEFFTLLATKDYEPVFSFIFESLDGGDDRRTQVMIAITRQLNQDNPTRLETVLFKKLENFELRPVRQKISILSRMQILVSELNSETIILWLARFLKKIIAEPVGIDDELQRKSLEILAYMRRLGPGLDQRVDQLGDRIRHVEDAITSMKNYPRVLRERGDGVANGNDLEQGMKMLDAEYHAMLEKMFSFDDFVNKLEFKHLIMDLIDEWHHAKDYLLDDLNVVKLYLEDMIGKKMQENQETLDRELNNLKARMEILLAGYGELVNIADKPSLESESDAGNMASKISLFMTNSLIFDLDLSKLQMDQSKEAPAVKELVESWQTYTENIECKIDDLQAMVDRWLDQRLHVEGAVENDIIDMVALQRFFTTYVRSSIKELKAISDELQEDDRQIASNLLLKNFERAEKSINFKKNKLLDVIETKAHHFEKYWRKLSKAAIEDLEFVVSAGRLKDEWLAAKMNIAGKVQQYYHDQLERVDAENLKHMLEIVNPIPIDALKSHLKSIQGSNDVEYIERLLDIIQKHHVNAEIQNMALINVQEYLLANQLQNYIKTKAMMVTKANTIEVKVMAENTSIQDIYDLAGSIELPPFFELNLRTGESKRKSIALLEPGKRISFTWNIKEIQQESRNGDDESLQSAKISILIGGKLFGDRYFNKIEEIQVICRKT